jgi:hypothetical protein
MTGHYASEIGAKENTSVFNDEKVKTIAADGGIGNIFKSNS